MAFSVVDSLEIILGGNATKLVAAYREAQGGAVSAATAEERRTVASTQATLAADKEAAALAKLNLAQAKASGVGGGAGSAEQLAAAAATDKLAVSKADASLASIRLKNATTEEQAALTAAGATAGESEGLFSRLSAGVGGASGAMGLLAAAAPAALAFLGAKILKDGISNFLEMTDTIRKLQGVIGGSAEQVSLLVGRFQALGVPVDGVDKAIIKLGGSIGDGTSKLGKYGIEVARNKDGTTDMIGTLNNVRVAWQGTNDAATRDAIVKQASARAGINLLPILKATDDQLKEIDKNTKERGGIYSQNDLTTGRNLEVATRELSLSFKETETTLAKGIIPALTEALKGVTSIVNEANKLNSKTGGFLFDALSKSPFIAILDKVIGKTNDQSKAAAQLAVDTKAANAALAEQAKADETLTGAVTSQFSAQRSLESSQKGLESATISATKAQDAYDTLLKAGPVDAKAVETAQKDLATAYRDVANAQYNLGQSSRDIEKALDTEAKAQDTLNKARQGASALDLAEANLKVADSADQIAKAQEGVRTAQEKLNALEGSGSASQDEIISAQNAVKAAIDAVTGAQINQGRAVENLGTVKQKGSPSDPAVIAAQEALANSHDGVAQAEHRRLAAEQAVVDAVGRVKDAGDKLKAAQAGDPDFQAKLAAAAEGVAQAHDAVAIAQDGVQSSSWAVHEATLKLNEAYANNAVNLGLVNAELGPYVGYMSILNSLAGGTGYVPPNGPGAGPAVGPLLPGETRGPGPAPTPAGSPGTTGTGIFGTIIGSVPISPVANNPAPAPFLNPPKGKFAAGGYAEPYGTYLVGEGGKPELLTMGSRGGTVTPMGAGGGGWTQNNHTTIYATTGATARDIAHELGWTLLTIPTVPVHGSN